MVLLVTKLGMPQGLRLPTTFSVTSETAGSNSLYLSVIDAGVSLLWSKSKVNMVNKNKFGSHFVILCGEKSPFLLLKIKIC